MLKAVSSSGSSSQSNLVNVSSYGSPTNSDDSTTIQNAFDAAVSGSRQLYFDGPPGTVWYVGATIYDTSGALSCPRITDVNTSTGVITLDRAHNLTSGDVVSLVGSNIGSGGGTTQINAYSEYFANVVSSTTIKLYDTSAHAISGGTTGLYKSALNVTTGATFNTLTTSGSMSSGASSVTVTDASKIIAGDTLNFVGNNGAVYYTVTGVVGSVISFTPNYSGSTVTSGSTVWTSSLDVTSTLSFESGSTVSFTGPSTNNNSFGSFVVVSISGSTLHLNQPPNGSLPTPGASQTAVLGAWINPANTNTKFLMTASPGVIVRKKSTLSGTMFQFSYGSSVTVEKMEIWGKTPGYTPDPGIVSGDDGIRFFGCNKVVVDNCILKNFGDSALRAHCSSYWVGARSSSYPDAGTYSNNVVVKNCYIQDCFQLSTTNTSNYYMGGSHNVWFSGNYFENLGGSIKFATRAPGSSNIYLETNIINTSGRHGFELDSYTNYQIHRNTILNCTKYGVYLIANNLQAIGFAFNEAKIVGNMIKAGSKTGTSSSSGGLYISMDTYPDSTLWDYRGLHILNNEIYDFPTGARPVQIASGCFTGLRIEGNTIENCAVTGGYFYLTPRASSTAGFENNITLKNNIARKCVGTQATMFYIYALNPTAGGPYVRGIEVSGNQFNSLDVSLGSSGSNVGSFFQGDYLQDVRIHDNRWNGYGRSAVYIQNEAAEITVKDNDFVNLNNAAGGIISFTNTNGVLIDGNKINQTYNGTAWLIIDRQCRNVRLGDNDLSQSTRKTYSVSNVRITTAANSYQTREEYFASAPASGTWNAGDRYWLTAPSAGSTPGGICTTSGTYTAITATGDSSSGSAIISNISSMSNICVGMYVTHSGFTGTRKVTQLGTNSVTLDANATSTQVGASISVANPVFKNMASLAA